jgi:hypothetical protein
VETFIREKRRHHERNDTRPHGNRYALHNNGQAHDDPCQMPKRNQEKYDPGSQRKCMLARTRNLLPSPVQRSPSLRVTGCTCCRSPDPKKCTGRVGLKIETVKAKGLASFAA